MGFGNIPPLILIMLVAFISVDAYRNRNPSFRWKWQLGYPTHHKRHLAWHEEKFQTPGQLCHNRLLDRMKIICDSPPFLPKRNSGSQLDVELAARDLVTTNEGGIIHRCCLNNCTWTVLKSFCPKSIVYQQQIITTPTPTMPPTIEPQPILHWLVKFLSWGLPPTDAPTEFPDGLEPGARVDINNGGEIGLIENDTTEERQEMMTTPPVIMVKGRKMKKLKN